LQTSTTSSNDLLLETLSSLQPLFAKGLSEYDLINILKQPPYCLFDEQAMRDSLCLFQTHFILFNALYRLRIRWRAQRKGELDIHTTCIKLKPMVIAPQAVHTSQIDDRASKASISTALEFTDPLASYYLDLSHLNDTNQHDVDALLESFWSKMTGVDLPCSLGQADIAEHLAIMQIDDIENVSPKTLKAQYRKLQHDYHPDKGGTVEQSQSLLASFKILDDYLRNASGRADKI